jgi:hypothetical protein
MALKHDFWSIRGQMTNLADGFCNFRAIIVKEIDIPVATGRMIAFLIATIPNKYSHACFGIVQ